MDTLSFPGESHAIDGVEVARVSTKDWFKAFEKMKCVHGTTRSGVPFSLSVPLISCMKSGEFLLYVKSWEQTTRNARPPPRTSQEHHGENWLEDTAKKKNSRDQFYSSRRAAL